MHYLLLLLIITLPVSALAQKTPYLPSDGLEQKYKPDEFKAPEKKENEEVRLDETLLGVYLGFTKHSLPHPRSTLIDKNSYSHTLSSFFIMPFGEKYDFSVETTYDMNSNRRFLFPTLKDTPVREVKFFNKAAYGGWRTTMGTKNWVVSWRLGVRQISPEGMQDPLNLDSQTGLSFSPQWIGKYDKHHLILLNVYVNQLNELSPKSNDQYSGLKKFTKGSIKMENYNIGLRFAHMFAALSWMKTSWMLELERFNQRKNQTDFKYGRITMSLGVAF